MKDKLISAIESIKGLKNIEHFDEQATKQTIILQLLSTLNWNTYNRDEVYPEFSVENKRVDYSLQLNKSNKVFIEVKRINEDLENHQEQLLNYSFKLGVRLAILTNGITWWFYLPLKEGNWKQRKFYSIDIMNQNIEEVSEKLISFLSKENISSDKAIQNAEETLKSNTKEIEIEKSLPVVWENLINKPTIEFIQLLVDETEKYCGYRPTEDYVVKYLNNLNHKIEAPIIPPIKTIKPKEYKISYTKQIQNPNSLASKMLDLISKKQSISQEELKKLCVEKKWSKNINSGSIGASIIALIENNLIEDTGRGNSRVFKIKNIL